MAPKSLAVRSVAGSKHVIISLRLSGRAGSSVCRSSICPLRVQGEPHLPDSCPGAQDPPAPRSEESADGAERPLPGLRPGPCSPSPSTSAPSAAGAGPRGHRGAATVPPPRAVGTAPRSELSWGCSAINPRSSHFSGVGGYTAHTGCKRETHRTAGRRPCPPSQHRNPGPPRCAEGSDRPPEKTGQSPRGLNSPPRPGACAARAPSQQLPAPRPQPSGAASPRERGGRQLRARPAKPSPGHRQGHRPPPAPRLPAAAAPGLLPPTGRPAHCGHVSSA